LPSTETCRIWQALDYGYEHTNIQQELQLLGCLSQETEFANFVKKGAVIYNLMGKEITSSKSKEQAKSRMKKDYKEIEKSVDKLCLQQSSL
jgi:hypothetical protein